MPVALAGSDVVDIVYISDILYGDKKLDDYHFLNLPGGFLDGDDLGSAKANANRIRHAEIRRAGKSSTTSLSGSSMRGS